MPKPLNHSINLKIIAELPENEVVLIGLPDNDANGASNILYPGSILAYYNPGFWQYKQASIIRLNIVSFLVYYFIVDTYIIILDYEYRLNMNLK
ncbi:MAG: hypothetical protein OEV66_04110 [Spirochaetia bacterium]|nr:hypothetical protein [Spirochaetia bacterium]